MLVEGYKGRSPLPCLPPTIKLSWGSEAQKLSITAIHSCTPALNSTEGKRGAVLSSWVPELHESCGSSHSLCSDTLVSSELSHSCGAQELSTTAAAQLQFSLPLNLGLGRVGEGQVNGGCAQFLRSKAA